MHGWKFVRKSTGISREKGVAMQWRAAGSSYTEVVTDEPTPHAVRRIAEPPSYGAPAP